jgi:hypothetical protein
MNISSIETGQVALNPTMYSLKDIFDNGVHKYQSEADKKGL